jgi:hypothetical protein
MMIICRCFAKKRFTGAAARSLPAPAWPAGWVGQCAAQLMPLVAAMKQHLKSQSVIHADETPVKLLAPGTGGTHQAYVWAYRSSDLEMQTSDTGRCVIYEFATSRAGEHARLMLKGWHGTLLTDDYSGYKALFAAGHVKEAGCWAHARRKFFEAHKLNQRVRLRLRRCAALPSSMLLSGRCKASVARSDCRYDRRKAGRCWMTSGAGSLSSGACWPMRM